MLKKNRLIKKYITILLILLFILMPSIEVKANEKTTSINMKDVEKFTDEFFAENMDKYHVPGAAIAFIKDGQVSFMKGYGYSDVENKISVDPEKTVFGIASVSKLLTATAVMQQYEEGNIDLNKNVNEYLQDFIINDTFKEPITMKSLLTHSSGFIQSSIGIGARDPREVKELGDYLKTAIPKREYEPNTFFSYSNQGMSLAGYIVENTSGTKFENYIQERIFKPLNMDNSSFKQPVPESMEHNKAVSYGYWSQKQSFFRTEPMYDYLVPSDGCYTTVSDMSKFIIANLNGGKYDGNQILKETTMEEMHKQQFTNNEKMPGQAYGFWESFENNKMALFHTGTSDGYANMLYMIPEENIGFMLCYNLASEKLRSEFLTSFLDEFYPVADSETVTPLKDYEERVNKYNGLYWNVEKPRDTLDKLEVLMSDGLVKAKANKDGTLKLTGYYGEDMGDYIEIEPEVFQKVNGEDIITFNESNSKENRGYLYIRNNAFEKVKWYENPMISIIFALFSLFVVIASTFVWIKTFIRKKAKSAERSSLEKYAGYIGLFSSVLILIFCTSTAIVTLKLGKYAFMFGIPISLKVILIIPILLCGVLVCLLAISILAWKNSCWTRIERYIFTIYTIAVLMFLMCLKFWNMI
ncbi:class A beta-lactamase-related serine hydrolase [Clostridium chromiireducens]|uniref:Class A beta-lactamase-related serine hydrolase n=1 Tax=Clostridium chromiireducens TaxID=225345 RepID=A0A399IN43_9CLOT|nr:serine hydrolase domain-containing protein [Clostridium chromiireducens]RII34351.1 class A beta-lactamase-related serine hydrolase [Clostridium chromiireducens]